MTTAELLARLVSVGSPYPEELAMQSFITAFFLKQGYPALVQPVEGDRANIIVEKGEGERTILLYSHLDTVPLAAGWTRDPLKPEIEGDRLYGLGAFDMKGGMAVNIRTFLNFTPKHFKLKLLFAVDEEYISKGGHVFAASTLMQDVACVLSPEPAFAYGTNGVVTGRIGRAVIVIRLKRPSEHFYYYEPDRDISLAAAAIVSAISKLYRQRDGKKEFAFVRAMRAQSSGMSTPETVELELDASVPAPETPESMRHKIERTVRRVVKSENEVTVEVVFKERATPFLSGYELPEDDQFLKLMKGAVAKETGKPAVSYFRSSVADENIFGAAGKSVLGIGPVGGNAHGANEWVSLASLKELERIYGEFLRRADASLQ